MIPGKYHIRRFFFFFGKKKRVVVAFFWGTVMPSKKQGVWEVKHPQSSTLGRRALISRAAHSWGISLHKGGRQGSRGSEKRGKIGRPVVGSKLEGKEGRVRKEGRVGKEGRGRRVEVGGRRCECRAIAVVVGLCTYLRMEELAGGSSRGAHHSFPAVTRCHALLRCLFNGTLPPPSAPFPHSPFLRRRFWPLLTFPPLPRPLINPPGASAFSSQFSRPSIPLSLLCSYTHTLGDVALLLLLLHH